MEPSPNPTAADIVRTSLSARGAILIVLNVDGTFEVSWSNLTYIEALGLAEALKHDIHERAGKGAFAAGQDADEE